GDGLGAMRSPAPVRPVDVAHDDRDVLERAVVAARVRGDRPATRRQVFRQLDRLLAQPETDDAHAEPEDALEALVVLARHLDVRDGLEPEDVGEEAYRAVHVRYGDPHGVDRPDERAPRPGRRRGREGEREEPGGNDGGAPRARRSRRWSPTLVEGRGLPEGERVGVGLPDDGDVPHRVVPVSGGDVEVIETPRVLAVPTRSANPTTAVMTVETPLTLPLLCRRRAGGRTFVRF